MFETISEIILKVTRDCNLRCQYCYIKDKDKYKNEEMTEDTFCHLIDRIVLDKQKSFSDHRPNLQIIFHGGEPTLLGVDKLKKFVRYAKDKIPQATFSMQTNLTKIDQGWIDFFKENNITPGVSIDGFEKDDNKLRLKNFSFYEKLELLKKSGVGYGPLMVLTKNNIENFYINALNILAHSERKTFKANYSENTYTEQAADPEVTAQELKKYFLIPLLKHFISKEEFIEDNFSASVYNFVNNYVFTKEFVDSNFCYAHCMTKFCAGGNNLVEVDPEGNVCFCGRWSDANELNLLGNFKEKGDFLGIRSFARVLNVHVEKIKDIRNKNCDNCFAQDVCGFGCIAFSYDKFNGKVKIREELVCKQAKNIKNLFLKNKYLIIYKYVKAKGYEIIKDGDSVYLNIPILEDKYKHKKEIDENIVWTEFQNKIYLKMPFKLIEAELWLE